MTDLHEVQTRSEIQQMTRVKDTAHQHRIITDDPNATLEALEDSQRFEILSKFKNPLGDTVIETEHTPTPH
jgi:hypothetical protein